MFDLCLEFYIKHMVINFFCCADPEVLVLSVEENKKIRSILFVFLADSRANSDKGAAKAEFHMMQMLWNVFPGVHPANRSARHKTHRHMGEALEKPPEVRVQSSSVCIFWPC